MDMEEWSEYQIRSWKRKEVPLKVQLVEMLFNYYCSSHFVTESLDKSLQLKDDSAKWIAGINGIPFDEETGHIIINEGVEADINALEFMHKQLELKFKEKTPPDNVFTAVPRLPFETALKNRLTGSQGSPTISNEEMFHESYRKAWDNIGYRLGIKAVYLLVCILTKNDQKSDISMRALRIIQDNIAGYRINERLYALYKGGLDKNDPLSLGEKNVAKLYGIQYEKRKKVISDYNVLEYYLQLKKRVSSKEIEVLKSTIPNCKDAETVVAIEYYTQPGRDIKNSSSVPTIDYSMWTSMYETFGLSPLYIIASIQNSE